MSATVGWYLLAFLPELEEGINPLEVGGQSVIAIRCGGEVTVFDATCPHRGANLGYGGKLDRDCIVCPFHGKRIKLGGDGQRRLTVGQHYVTQAGEAVFVRIGDDPSIDRGFEVAIKEAARTHQIVAATVTTTRIDAEFIVENAFDVDHFFAVHNVPRIQGMKVTLGESGELTIDGEFRTAASPFTDDAEEAIARQQANPNEQISYTSVNRFYARAYSPHVVLTEFGDPSNASVVITGAVPLKTGGCQARVAIGVKPNQLAAMPFLIAGAEKALAQDVVVWDHMDLAAPERLDARDSAVIAFRMFCNNFSESTS